MDEIRESEKRAELLRAKNEEYEQELSLAEKKAAIRQAKQMYGADWKRIIGGAIKGVRKLKVDKEVLQNLHSLGMGGQEIRDLSNPAYLRKYK